MQKLIYLVAGARPNFMKIAPIVRALNKKNDKFKYQIIHTGQHYDQQMSEIFFEELGIPNPDYHLECGGGSHAEQTGKIMVAFEKVCLTKLPDCVLVVGDVNSTLACSIVAKKFHIPVAHVEAGLRSGDRGMPEEINRLVTDSISDWFFCTEPSGVENLISEGHQSNHIFHVGHVMVDNLLYQLAKLDVVDKSDYRSFFIKKNFPRYGVVTLHRPSNVDDISRLSEIFRVLNNVAIDVPLIFPVHPRTQANLNKFNIEISSNIQLCSPLSYMDFLNLWKDALLVLTDSGGLQEETTALGVPCLTLRSNTERPITLTEGSNTLVGFNLEIILEEIQLILMGLGKAGHKPKFWDGYSAERIVDHLALLINGEN
jgi:UDP-N-acetylglucosamine 2-epimerase (non-hydrolysing)